MIEFKDIREQKELTEKFDAKKAEQTLRDIQKLFAQVKYVGADRNVIKRWSDMWYTTYTRWFTSKEMDKMKLPTELK